MHVAGALTLAAYIGVTSVALVLHCRSNISLGSSEETGTDVPVLGNYPWTQLSLMLKASLQNETSLFIGLNWFFAVCTATALLTTVIFLDRVSHRESARMAERLMKYIVQKFVFVAAISLGPDSVEIAMWIAWFYAVGFWRVFAGAAQDRMESLAVAPHAHPFLRVRAVLLLFMILVQGAASLHALRLGLSAGIVPPSYALLCALDASIILVEVSKGILTVGAHTVEGPLPFLSFLWRRAAPCSAASPFTSAWETWEGKGSFIYHVDLVMDTAVYVLTLFQYLQIWFIHGLKFMLVDLILVIEVRSMVVSLQRRYRAHVSYREATRCLDHAFPDKNLQLDRAKSSGNASLTGFECSICMETMTTAKQLPCGHHFHLACLRAWLQQSGSESFSCPLCRQPLLDQATHPSLGSALEAARLSRQPSANLESLQQLLPHPDDPGIMGSLGRARQSARLWFLAAAVGLVAAAVQGGEVVHHSRSSQRRESVVRRGPPRPQSRPPTSRRRMPWEEALGESADHPSDMSDEGHNTQESDAEGWGFDDPQRYDRHRIGREAAHMEQARPSQQQETEGWRFDAPETWLGPDAWGAIQSIQSSLGFGGMNLAALVGMEHDGGHEVLSPQQVTTDASMPISQCVDRPLPQSTISDRHVMALPQQREENVFESILTHSRRYRVPNLPSMPNMPSMAMPNMPNMPNMPSMAMPNMAMPNMAMPNMAMPNMAMPHMPNMPNMAMPHMPNMAMPNMAMPHMPNADPAQAVAAVTAAAAAAPGVAASAAEATAAATAAAAAAVAREISTRTGGAWGGWDFVDSRATQVLSTPARSAHVSSTTNSRGKSRRRGSSFAREP